MVSITSLWMSILLAPVLCFVMSSIIHMALKWHNGDKQGLPQEDAVLDALRKAGVTQGNYAFPYPPEGQSWTSPEMTEKFKRGPSGFLNVFPMGSVGMGKSLAQWFVYLLLVSVGVGWILAATVAPGAAYKHVFLVAMVASGLPYALAQLVPAIWMGQNGRTTLVHMLDGVLYALLTGGAFAGLWPG